MKVGDIYFQQMEKPDRDPQNAVHAEQEYRTMLEQFPDSPLIPRAKQRLREVQEVLAQRQFEIGEFYASREQWAASVARLETITDTYPLFSHSDQALITIGDAYANEAQVMSRAKIPAQGQSRADPLFRRPGRGVLVPRRHPLSSCPARRGRQGPVDCHGQAGSRSQRRRPLPKARRRKTAGLASSSAQGPCSCWAVVRTPSRPRAWASLLSTARRRLSRRMW